MTDVNALEDAWESEWRKEKEGRIAAQADNERLRRALEFYADPDTYFAIGFFPDPPNGDFMEDFEELRDGAATIVKPGKRARKALSTPLSDNAVGDALAILKGIQQGPEPLPDYLFGIRCGLEDRGLQDQPYEAAEYGYQQGLEYCADLAAQALAPFTGAKG